MSYGKCSECGSDLVECILPSGVLDIRCNHGERIRQLEARNATLLAVLRHFTAVTKHFTKEKGEKP